MPLPAEDGVCTTGLGKRVSRGLSPRRLGHDGITASWGSSRENLSPCSWLCCSLPSSRSRQGREEEEEEEWGLGGGWEDHLHIPELPRGLRRAELVPSLLRGQTVPPGLAGDAGQGLAMLGQRRAFLHTYLEVQ